MDDRARSPSERRRPVDRRRSPPTASAPHELVIEAWTDRYATWRHEVEVKVARRPGRRRSSSRRAACSSRSWPSASPGADQERLLRGGDGRAPHRRARSTCASTPRATTPSPRSLAGLPDARRSESRRHPRVGRPARAPRWAPGTSCSRGRSAGSRARPSTSTTWPTSASTSCTCRRSTRSASPTARAGTTRSSAGPDDPGSPWAIGGAEGGHDAIHPDLGTLADFDAFVARAGELGLEVALDYALQASPDHPWVRDHPEWFTRRPDGSIRYAENPPKKYQDIHPIDFWPADEADRVALWEACRDVLLGWVERGHPHVPRRQPAHEAARVLGVAHRRRPPRPPRRRVPGRGVHRRRR